MSRHIGKHKRVRLTNVLILFNTFMSLVLAWFVLDIYRLVDMIGSAMVYAAITLAKVIR